ncbi:hypothetical protein LPB137_10380 [Poseidonibacter parvus]|uniref:Glycosyl transferase family 1 domain-containing protein n=1 Tax=Poseidonibacter parvus TaxID=1850254 RepID=A0A1P8KNZ3_9BACT|nr:glycosyltransferase family 4 protein [Poseidonibacter parvus]APW66221.1 hypothetical protein LPB137_10380 [Poseidonibacter parvus]
MIKIVHIVLGKANPNRMNGVNKVVHNLASTQVRLGHQVIVIGLTNSFDEDHTIKRNYSLNLYTRKKYFLDNKLVEDIKKFDKNTIFHIHGGFIIDFYSISKMLYNLNHRYIFTSHGAYNKEAMNKRSLIKNIFFNLFDKKILERAWKVQFLGKSEYLHIDNLTTKINKVLIPNGQNLDELKFDFYQINSKNKPIFGFVGRIDSHTKGLDLLLKAFNIYKKEKGSGELWIVGDGPDLNDLKKVSEINNLANSVVFYGSKFGNEKLNLLSNMDVFVHTSRFEGFPMAVLEAAGLRKPLLISKETNFENYVEEFNCGLILKENNSNEIKDKLHQFQNILLSDELHIMGEKSYQMIKQHFSWEKINNELIEEKKWK